MNMSVECQTNNGEEGGGTRSKENIYGKEEINMSVDVLNRQVRHQLWVEGGRRDHEQNKMGEGRDECVSGTVKQTM